HTRPPTTDHPRHPPPHRNPLTPLGCRTGPRRLNHLAHRPKRGGNRQGLAPPSEERRPPPNPQPQLPQQRRLADPRLAGQEHDHSLSRTRPLDRSGKQLQLELTLKQRLHNQAIVVPAHPARIESAHSAPSQNAKSFTPESR